MTSYIENDGPFISEQASVKQQYSTGISLRTAQILTIAEVNKSSCTCHIRPMEE